MKKILYIVLGIVALGGLTSCEKEPTALLIGKWEVQSIQDESGNEVIWKSPSIWEFTNDNKVYVNEEYYTKWSSDGKDIVVEVTATDASGIILFTDYLRVDKLTSQILVLISDVRISTAGDYPCKWIFKRTR